MQRSYEDLVAEHDELYEQWKMLQKTLGCMETHDKNMLDQMHQLSNRMEVIRQEMEPVRPTILLSWYTVLPLLPVTDVEKNVITHATVSSAKKYGGQHGEQ